jgi:aminoglycoside 6'-N-acetyltransferase
MRCNDPFVFRPLTLDDLPQLQRWLSEPHVEAWWHTPLDLAGVQDKYGPGITGSDPAHTLIIELDARPIGFIQWYRWSDYREHALALQAPSDSAGIDLAIGERDMIGIGLGPEVIRQFVMRVIFADPDIMTVITDVEWGNRRSWRAFQKAGFDTIATVCLPGECIERHVMRLDRERIDRDALRVTEPRCPECGERI